MKMKIFELTLSSDRPIKGNAEQLRGFLGTRFREHKLLHQHDGEKYMYDYPLIQNKMIDNIPMIIGIGSFLKVEDGVSVLKDIYNKFDEIILGKNVYKITGRSFSIKNKEFGITNEMQSYKLFDWYPYSPKNYQKFLHAKNEKEIEELLKSILKGNIITISKRMNKLSASREYEIGPKIICDLHVKIKGKYKFHGHTFIMYDGSFDVNVQIPDYIGIGSNSSFGFGTVKRLKI